MGSLILCPKLNPNFCLSSLSQLNWQHKSSCSGQKPWSHLWLLDYFHTTQVMSGNPVNSTFKTHAESAHCVMTTARYHSGRSLVMWTVPPRVVHCTACKEIYAGSSMTLVQTIIISNLDYCNSFSTGFPVSAPACLLSILNIVAEQISVSQITVLPRTLKWILISPRMKAESSQWSMRSYFICPPSPIASLILLTLFQSQCGLCGFLNLLDKWLSQGLCTYYNSIACFLTFSKSLHSKVKFLEGLPRPLYLKLHHLPPHNSYFLLYVSS